MPNICVKNQFMELFQDGIALEFKLDNELYVYSLVYARHNAWLSDIQAGLAFISKHL